jgi:hypothetical protein
VARTRWRLASAAALAAALSHPTLAPAGTPAFAEGDSPAADPLAAGRTLFAEALADEAAGHWQVALDKFQRVKTVRDTAPVEYRIGTCHDGLGHLAPAYEAYRAAIALGAPDPSMADVVQAARVRLETLSKHVARLTLVVPAGADADLSVQVDLATFARDALGQPVALEPGTHEVVATADGRVVFRSEVTLPEGGQASLPIVLAARSSSPPSTDRPIAPDSSRHTLGWILVGTGAALLAGAGAALLLRHADIATLNSACPRGVCPADRESDLESTRDRALAEGPVAAGLAAGGVAAAALGLYFVVAGQGPTPAVASFHLPATGLAIAGSFW